jgi:carbon-monoxide dehydrogenase small subunit
VPVYRFTLNGKKVECDCNPNRTLLDILRNYFKLTGTKEGCNMGECGACTVIMDGTAVNSCLVLIAQAEGRDILTVEGLRKDSELDVLQRAFIDEGAVQCGYCTPGMLMSAKALLIKNIDPTEAEIRRALAGNLCRCTGYTKIVRAVKKAACEMGKEVRP